MNQKLMFNRSGMEWLSSLPVTVLLLAMVVFGTGEMVHSQLLGIGNHYWSGYHELRTDPKEPSCDLNRDIDAEVEKRFAEQGQNTDDDFGLFAPTQLSREDIRSSLESSKESCEKQFAAYEDRLERITPGVEMFRSVEKGVSKLSDISLNANRYVLVFLLLICAITTTMMKHHIALRPMMTRVDYQVSLAAQLIGNVFIFISAIRYRDVQLASGIGQTGSQLVIEWAWIIGFGLLVLASLWRVIQIPREEVRPGGSIGKALLAIPLYTFMALISGITFFLESHHAGIIIYLGKMLDLSGLFINVGLYVWIGMLLKQTRMATLVFDSFRPWKMPAEMLAFFALVVSAAPTAYTGASGIYVIAVGAVIYGELRRVGARRQLALATTAMSGSMGVVLRPCLLVVIIAALNKEVTTSAIGDAGIFSFDQMHQWGLYTAGVWIFLLTAILFLVFALIGRENKITFASPSEAMPEMIKTLKRLAPYFIVLFGVAIFYDLALDGQMDEFSAPIILPVIMLCIVFYDQYARRKDTSEHYSLVRGTEHAVRGATNETTAHIGALLMLMGMSICVGGIADRADAAAMLPQDLESIWLTLAILAAMLVVIGMVMDPYGAVILVTITLAQFAYENGIDPLHFWMITLVAFELGYLTPPVALNHLLTRQVVGEEEVEQAVDEVRGKGFYRRFERILLPIAVMFTALLMVTFIPPLFYS
ncbi:MAG: TRAP transporter large permease subunit [Pseudomonadota bacterium]